MSIPINCYDYIIGLSETPCTCYDDGKPADFDVSNSGLYLDQLEPLNKITGLDNCENVSVWRAMETARDNAVKRFVADTNSRIVQEYNLKRRIYKGGIGRMKYTADKTVQRTYAGLRMYCADIISGVAKITNINTIFNATGTIELNIYNNLNELVSGSHTLNTVANTLTANALNIELPLHSEYTDNLEYYFLYTYNSGIVPKNNDLSCNCGSFRPTFNLSNPYFNKKQSQRYGWANYVMVSGYETDELDFMDICLSGNNYMFGLIPEVEMYCRIGDVLCKDVYDVDFTSNPKAAAMAHAIYYKAAEILLRWLLTNPDLNRITMINTEVMEKFMMDYLTKYKEMLEYVIADVDLAKTDCIECRDKIKLINAGILS